MDYKVILKSQLLSNDNINFIVSQILQDFTISKKAVNKCSDIVTNNLIKYLDNIHRYPENNDELNKAINYLNKKCYDDFALYLAEKFPNRNHLRTLPPKQPSPEPIQSPLPPIEEMVIISEEEKNELINKYSSKNQMISSNDFLSYLANPAVLQMFYTVTNQINQPNKLTIIIDEILNEQQVQNLIEDSKKFTEYNDTENEIENEIEKWKKEIEKKNEMYQFEKWKKETEKEKFEETEKRKIDKGITEKEKFEETEKRKIDKGITEKEKFEETEKEKFEGTEKRKIDKGITEKTEKEKTEKEEMEENTEKKKGFDLSKLTKNDLPLIQEKINELISLKNIYLKSNEMDKVKKINSEIFKINEAVLSYKKELEKEVNENENKINNIICSSTKSEDEDNVEYLDLKFDPTSDHNDLKNIVIKFKTDDKVTDITLVSYYLPINHNNVTRFNNKFIVRFNSVTNRIIIPPGKYDINAILDYIKNQCTFLDFDINDNKIITIKNILGQKFDLMATDDSIFRLLGFTGKVNSYKDQLFYSGSVEYKINCNEKVFFYLSGTNKDPFLMEFDQDITLNKSLRRSSIGTIVKQMILNFTDGIEQNYDFTVPFKMCFKITYFKS